MKKFAIKKEKIKAIVKNPGNAPRVCWISNSLEAMQRQVGGHIETVTLASDVVIICNEEGRLNDLPYNCEIAGIDFVGPVMIVGAKGDEFEDLPEGRTKALLQVIHYPGKP